MNSQSNILRHLALLLMVSILGIFLLIGVNLTFNNLLTKLDSQTNNLEAKIQIGEYITNDLNAIRSNFYKLTITTTNSFTRTLVEEEINKRLKEIENAITVLKKGGTLKKTIYLNLVEQAQTIKYISYKKENPNEISLEAIDLQPKLLKIKEKSQEITQLLEKRDKAIQLKDAKQFFKLGKEVKSFYKTIPPFFERIIENTGRLLYEGEIELQILQKKISKQKDSYIYLELILIFVIILLMIIFGIVIAKQINQNSKNLLYFNQQLNLKIKELESQEASTRGILDAQPNIIVVSNGEEMIDANSALVDFFEGYESFEDFKNVHACICDYFEDMGSDEYIIDIDYEEGLWFEHILAHENSVHKVAMKSGEELHYFTIQATKKMIAEDNFIIIIALNDITKELLVNEELKKLNNNLETIVKEKTQKLRELNENLEERIFYEVELNREKDKKIIQQSRYAALGEMIANIAHQWRQPLSAISSTSSGISLQMDLNIAQKEDIKEALNSIDKYVNFLNHTIEDFRAFFKKDKEKVAFEINAIITNALNITQAGYKDSDITVTINSQEQGLISFGFPNELTQAFINILNNAKDALVENQIYSKQVSIHCYKENEQNIIEIYDNAGGIDETIISKIFDPYFTTKHQSQGTGIGLYMSKDIIEKNMQGLLVVSNKAFTIDNKSYYGACFKISIPSTKIT